MIVRRVAAIFARLRDDVAQLFPRVDQIVLVQTTRAGTSGRAFAYYDYEQQVMGVAPRLERQSPRRIEAVLRHELGHAVDSLYSRGHIERLLGPVASTPERMADDIAAQLWGEPIRYDADLVQTLGPGVSPRPARLGL